MAHFRLTVSCLVATMASVLASAAHTMATETDKAPLVSADLLTSAAAIEPGGSFWVGVQFNIRPHWHIYWHNPGDSGMATDIAWTVPEGWEVGPIQWPIPIRFTQAGDIVGYGYEKQVMLMAKVTAAKDAVVGKRFTITAEPAWLVCKDVCLPGDAKVTTQVEIASATKPQHTALFVATQKQLPQTDAAAVTVEKASKTHRIALQFKRPVADLTVYPHADPLEAVHDLKWTVSDDGKTAAVTYRIDKPTDQRLGFLVKWADADGSISGQNVFVE